MRISFQLPRTIPVSRYQAGLTAILATTAFVGMQASSLASQAPLPPSRPLELRQDADQNPEPVQPPSPEVSEEGMPDTERTTSSDSGLPSACAALAEAGIITATPVVSLKIPRPCNFPAPVSLTAVQLDDGSSVSFKPAAIMNCEMVVAMADWTREDLAPSIEQLGAKLKTLRVASSYSCRGRNRQAGARTSEHGFGNAMDVGGFILSDDRDIPVAPRGMPNAFALAMKESACRRFATVLGPGSDGYHETHIHVDLAKRRNGFKLCRWRLPGSTTPERRYVSTSATEIVNLNSTAPAEEKTQSMRRSMPLPPVKPDIPEHNADQ